MRDKRLGDIHRPEEIGVKLFEGLMMTLAGERVPVRKSPGLCWKGGVVVPHFLQYTRKHVSRIIDQDIDATKDANCLCGSFVQGILRRGNI